MSSKNIFKSSAGRLAVITSSVSIILQFLSAAASVADDKALQIHQQPQINVVYPKPLQIVTATDSTFILGHLQNVGDDWNAILTINDIPVRLHLENSFLAFIPIMPDTFTFVLKCELTPKGKQSELQPMSISREVKVYIPPPIKNIPLDTMVIAQDYNPPRGDLVLAAGDELIVSFLGTPAHRAWFSLPGVVDSAPMSETQPQSQAYWGEAVFGAGAVPESLLVQGIYSGCLTVPQNAQIDTAHIVYHLAPPSAFAILSKILSSPHDTVASRFLKYLVLKSIPAITSASSYRVTLNSPNFPFTVRFADSVQTVRHGPMKGYQSIFQPKDVEALAVGAEQDWYKIQLSKMQYGWVHDTSIEKLGPGIRPPVSFLKAIRTKGNGRKFALEFPLAGQHPFRVIEDDRQTLRLQLFGVFTDTDWIRYDFGDSLVDLISWSQPEEGLYEVKIRLNENIWGFDTYYKGNTFFLELIKPPDNVRSIKGKVIVIDPGHSADPGSIGPTGYTEAEANLGLALALKNKLESRGAKVIMTRMDQSNVALNERPTIAKLNGADLFVSVHNNALPDGVNPYKNNGTSTYYYHPHSIDLGRAIHKEMLKATALPDHGFYHGNLAVNRPTQYPAVLVECAFMIIPEQEAMLKTDAYRRKVADAVTRGIENYLKDFDRE